MKTVITGWITQSEEATEEGDEPSEPIIANFQVEEEGGVAKIFVNGITDQDVIAKLLKPLHRVNQIVYVQTGSDEE